MGIITLVNRKENRRSERQRIWENLIGEGVSNFRWKCDLKTYLPYKILHLINQYKNTCYCSDVWSWERLSAK